jgi:RNA polymerase sigma-32 factor
MWPYLQVLVPLCAVAFASALCIGVVSFILGWKRRVPIARRSSGANYGGRYHGPRSGFADSHGRYRPFPLLEEIRRFPMLEPQQEYMLTKSWREHGDRDAAHKLVTSHLRLVAKLAMGYRGYGLPIAEVISEGNVGLMQAVKRFEPEKGRLATYAMWWIKAVIKEYILRSWSLVKMGTTANQKKLFFNLRKAKSRISALEEGDLRPDQVKLIAKRLGVPEQDVVDMNRRLGGDVSLNAPFREDGDSGEWQDWLADEGIDQETRLADSEQSDNRRKALGEALTVLNERERRIFEARRLADEPITLEDLGSEFGVSRERVRQIEVRAFEKVQKAVKNRSAAMESPQALPAHCDDASCRPSSYVTMALAGVKSIKDIDLRVLAS